MYAIIATGGKQYKVSEGDVIKVEKPAPVMCSIRFWPYATMLLPWVLR